MPYTYTPDGRWYEYGEPDREHTPDDGELTRRIEQMRAYLRAHPPVSRYADEANDLPRRYDLLDPGTEQEDSVPAEDSRPRRLPGSIARALEIIDARPAGNFDALLNLAAVVRAELADDGNRELAVPVPGVTSRMGYEIRAVLPARYTQHQWYVAAMNDGDGRAVTWLAARNDETGQLSYSGGRYFQESASAVNWAHALADLADRGGLSEALNAHTDAQREAFEASYREAFTKLTERYGWSRARTREAMAKAAALGESRITGTSYVVAYNRQEHRFRA